MSSSISNEERMLRWIFNAKDEQTMDVWFDVLRANNFTYTPTHLMFIEMCNDWECDEDAFKTIKSNGFYHYYNNAHDLIKYNKE